MRIPSFVKLGFKGIEKTIMKIDKAAKEIILLFLKRDNKELYKRYREIKSGEVTSLPRDQALKCLL